MTIFSRTAAAVLSIACIVGPYSVHAIAAPTEITDALGRKVTVDVPAKRIVINFNFEEFTAVAGVDGWKRVVGMTRAAWENWRPAIWKRYSQVIPNLAQMPDVGLSDDNSFSAEKVIALKPDVLFMSNWGFEALKAQKDQIEAAGIPIVVIDYNAQALDRHLASTRAVGRVVGAEARAEELAALYEAKYKDVLARVARVKQATRPKVYLELGQGGVEAVGKTYSKSMWGTIIANLGAENIAEGKLAGPWGPLAAEAVIAANPDAIFIGASSWANRPKSVRTGYDIAPETTRATLAPYATRPGWADLKAFKTGNVHAIEHGLCRTLFDFVAYQYIGKQLYPEEFKDVDPEASFKEYHARYLPVSYNGTWMARLTP